MSDGDDEYFDVLAEECLTGDPFRDLAKRVNISHRISEIKGRIEVIRLENEKRQQSRGPVSIERLAKSIDIHVNNLRYSEHIKANTLCLLLLALDFEPSSLLPDNRLLFCNVFTLFYQESCKKMGVDKKGKAICKDLSEKEKSLIESSVDRFIKRHKDDLQRP